MFSKFHNIVNKFYLANFQCSRQEFLSQILLEILLGFYLEISVKKKNQKTDKIVKKYPERCFILVQNTSQAQGTPIPTIIITYPNAPAVASDPHKLI